MTPTGYTIRPFETLDDYHACVRLQDEVWGPGFSECVPVAILMAAQRIGGVSAGAFADEDGRLLGFIFGMTGVEGGKPVHWSDMLAVRPGIRGGGLGLALKAYQRATLLERGVRTVLWTFDPLVAKNAWLNIEKLGVVAREYIPEMYGETNSPLHRGIGTDRLVALWRLDSARVVARFEGGKSGTIAAGGTASTPPVPVIEVRDGPDGPVPGEGRLGLAGARLLVPVPADIEAMKDAAPHLAMRWRVATREALVHYLGNRYTIEGFVRGGGVSHHVLVADRATDAEGSG